MIISTALCLVFFMKWVEVKLQNEDKQPLAVLRNGVYLNVLSFAIWSILISLYILVNPHQNLARQIADNSFGQNYFPCHWQVSKFCGKYFSLSHIPLSHGKLYSVCKTFVIVVWGVKNNKKPSCSSVTQMNIHTLFACWRFMAYISYYESLLLYYSWDSTDNIYEHALFLTFQWRLTQTAYL